MSESVVDRSCEAVGRESGGRREAILDAATSLFSEHGFNDADTQALAEKLGVGKGTLYRCFASKRELFLAAVDRAMMQLYDRVRSSTAGVADPLDRMARGVRGYLDFFAENPAYVELLIQERALFKDRKKPTYFEYRERQADLWRHVYGELIATGRVRPLSVDLIRDVVGQLLYGTVFMNYFAGAQKTPERQAEEIVDIVLRGILTDPERQRLSATAPTPVDLAG
jgi:AcrR family transcriptional regulator